VYQNPFTPVFGSEPPLLAGRTRLIENVLRGLDNAPGDPNRITIFTGPRGSGKTVLLSHIAAVAKGRGWICAQVAAESNMLSDLLDQVEKHAAGFLPIKSSSKLTEISVAGFGLSREVLPEKQLGWRAQMEAYLDILAEQEVGLLFTIDEVRASVPEMVQFVSTFQFFVRDKRNVALLMAGLPGNVMQMFQDDSISFLRRAFRRKLDPISLPEVRMALRETIEMTGRTIADAALRKAAERTNGLPFLIQLIGYHIFNQSGGKAISVSDVDGGIIDTREDMESMILEATLHNLSDVDRRFLMAMAEDDGESRIGDIARRMSVSSQYAGTYRHRLIEQGVIAPAGRGKLVFATPMLKELLRET